MDAELQKLRIEKHHKARRRGRSLAPWVVVLLLLGGGGIGAWQYTQAHTPVAVDTVRVRLPEPAARNGDLEMLKATGYIIAAHRIELASKVMGRVAWIGVEMGDRVEKDQVLVRLEDDEYKARVLQGEGQLDSAKARLAELVAGSRPQEIAQALAQLDRARIEYENAERQFQRLNRLRETGSISQPEFDDAEALMKARAAQVEIQRQQYELIRAGTRKEQIDAQRATVRQLEGILATARVDLDNTVIRSPIAATILERNVEVGEFVTTGFVGDRGAKGYVVSLADLNDLLVELDISQDDFSKVRSAQPCWIVTDAYRDRIYKGQVERISPLANRQKATVMVRVRIKNPDSLLKPDMNATVSFLSLDDAAQPTTAPTDNQMTGPRVPPTALRHGAVFVVEEGRAVRRDVTVGLTALSGEVEIRKGLIGGEDLIVNPPEGLKAGDRVKIRDRQS